MAAERLPRRALGVGVGLGPKAEGGGAGAGGAGGVGGPARDLVPGPRSPAEMRSEWSLGLDAAGCRQQA